MNDWTGQLTLARVDGGEVIWETLRQAEDRAPIAPVRVTPRQWQILRFLSAYRREHSGMPSYAQIAAAVDLRARSGVMYQLNLLEAKGLIERDRGRFSAIRLNVTL